MTDEAKQISITEPDATYPVVALRNVVVFPHMIATLFVGRDKSINALNQAIANGQSLMLVTQKNEDDTDPDPADLYTTGTLASNLQVLNLPDGTIKILVEGTARARISRFTSNGDYLEATATIVDEDTSSTPRVEALTRSLKREFTNYAKYNKKITPETVGTIKSIDDYNRFADNICAHVVAKIHEKQALLEEAGIEARLDKLLNLIDHENSVTQVERRLRNRVKQQMEKTQRDYYLNEQMKAIQKELHDEEGVDEQTELSNKIKATNLSVEAKEKAFAELKKLKQMSPLSAEATVVRNYLDWLLSIPWNNENPLSTDLVAARAILDRDHYGLDKIKEQILDYLAVQARANSARGPILCLVGPPGVGKTSLGQSLANATGREFIRVSLGGVRDEAEIRGHRRTYIGSMPGKIIQSLKKSKTSNPLFLLDEIDKMSTDFRGDPASALLEVLDPEQNNAFGDHYLEVDYDLSKVMFVTTANTLNIPLPLLDRMETIRLSGYTENEKREIAKLHVIPKAQKEHGLALEEMTITDDAIKLLIREYTREAGIRDLQRNIAKISRKVVRSITAQEKELEKEQVNAQENMPGKAAIQPVLDDQLASDTTAMANSKGDNVATKGNKAAAKAKSAANVKVSVAKTKSTKKSEEKTTESVDMAHPFHVTVTPEVIAEYLSTPKYRVGLSETENLVGAVTGLAWTEFGGELLTVEGTVVPGKGKLTVTGNLKDIMKESITAAVTYVKARAADFGIRSSVFANSDIHIHVPEGAIPKDGPSAGIAMVSVIVSALTGTPVRREVAMTGEVTLRGRVLPIGGLKEKLFAAVRADIKKVLIPIDNAKDLVDIPVEIKSALEIVPITNMDEVIEHILVTVPKPLKASEKDQDFSNLSGESKDQQGLITH